MATKKKGVEEVEFTKAQILASAKYGNSKDLVNALLDDGKTYTVESIDRKINQFMKGKVN